MKLPHDPTRAPRTGRWQAYAAVLALVVLLHALVLRALPWGAGDGVGAGARPAMQVRQIITAVAPQALPAPRQPSAADAAPDRPARAAPAPAVAAAPATINEAAAATEPAPEAPALADAGGQAPPTFATQFAPAVVLSYEMRRSGLRGEAQMVWQPRGERYTLALTGTAAGQPLLAWASTGGFDSAGLAPERFVNRSRGRDVRAANFQREHARISFSSSTASYPLLAGAQDRLSWMLQLPAIVQAAPQRFTPGTRIPVFVVGARGDADVWTFEVEAVEALDLPAGRIEQALRLLREPRRPYDTRVEVWLDPALHHLPVRVRLITAATGEGNEFVLKHWHGLPP